MLDLIDDKAQQTEVVLSVSDLTRTFPGVRAVDAVSFSVRRGTVHCLVGENGAGKSTLVKMLTGALRPTSGAMRINGADYDPTNPQDARQCGIATLFQELHVVDELTRPGEPHAGHGAQPLRVSGQIRSGRIASSRR